MGRSHGKLAAALEGALGVVLSDADLPDRPRRRRDLVELLAEHVTRAKGG